MTASPRSDCSCAAPHVKMPFVPNVGSSTFAGGPPAVRSVIGGASGEPPHASTAAKADAKRTWTARIGSMVSCAPMNGRILLFSGMLVAAAFGPACVGGKSGISAEDRDRLKAYVLDSVPPDAKKMDVNFENKIHLAGYKVVPEQAGPGTPVKITYYWRCEDPIEEGWMLFTHVQHDGYDKPDNLDGNGPLREMRGRSQILGPDKWERGKVYADEQSFTMPTDLRGPDTTVYVGIYKGDARLRIISGSNDGDNRAIVAKIKTGIAPKNDPGKTGARSPSDLPMIQPMKLAAGEKIVVDGKADDKIWGGAASTGPFV